MAHKTKQGKKAVAHHQLMRLRDLQAKKVSGIHEGSQAGSKKAGKAERGGPGRTPSQTPLRRRKRT